MSTPTDREQLARFIQLIGAAPRQAEFDESGNLIKLNLAGLGLRELPPKIGEFVRLEILILGQSYDYQEQSPETPDDEFNGLGNELTTLPVEISRLIHLRIFICENNRLISLPLCFTKLVNLKTIYLILYKLVISQHVIKQRS